MDLTVPLWKGMIDSRRGICRFLVVLDLAWRLCVEAKVAQILAPNWEENIRVLELVAKSALVNLYVDMRP
jgi:hypothetical protein